MNKIASLPTFRPSVRSVLASHTIMSFIGLDITPQGIAQLKTKLLKGWKPLTIAGVVGGRGRQ